MPRGTGKPKKLVGKVGRMKVRDLLELVTCRVVLNRFFRDGEKTGRDILYEGTLSKCPKDLLELNVIFLSPEGELSLYLHIEVE